MKETASDIIAKHHAKSSEGPLNNRVLEAMKEIADKAWDACAKRHYQEDYESEVTVPNKETFMKELFPETKEI